MYNPVWLTAMPGVSSKPVFQRWWWSSKRLLAPTFEILKTHIKLSNISVHCIT